MWASFRPNWPPEMMPFLPQMMNFMRPCDVYTQIVGIDNVRAPSATSFRLKNYETMLQMFPKLFSSIQVWHAGWPCRIKQELSDFALKLAARPDNYIAQPTLALSTVPIFTGWG